MSRKNIITYDIISYKTFSKFKLVLLYTFVKAHATNASVAATRVEQEKIKSSSKNLVT